MSSQSLQNLVLSVTKRVLYPSSLQCSTCIGCKPLLFLPEHFLHHDQVKLVAHMHEVTILKLTHDEVLVLYSTEDRSASADGIWQGLLLLLTFATSEKHSII